MITGLSALAMRFIRTPGEDAMMRTGIIDALDDSGRSTGRLLPSMS